MRGYAARSHERNHQSRGGLERQRGDQRHGRRRQRSVPAARLSADGQRAGVGQPSHFNGRGVPDVSGDADPDTGYQIHVDGQGTRSSAARARWHRCGRPRGAAELQQAWYRRSATSIRSSTPPATRATPFVTSPRGTTARMPRALAGIPAQGPASPRGNVRFRVGVSGSTTT